MKLQTRKKIGLVISTLLGVGNMMQSAQALPECSGFQTTRNFDDNVCVSGGSNCMDGFLGSGHDFLDHETYLEDIYQNGVQYYDCQGPTWTKNCCTIAGTPNCPTVETQDTCVTS